MEVIVKVKTRPSLIQYLSLSPENSIAVTKNCVRCGWIGTAHFQYLDLYTMRKYRSIPYDADICDEFIKDNLEWIQKCPKL